MKKTLTDIITEVSKPKEKEDKKKKKKLTASNNRKKKICRSFCTRQLFNS